MQWLLGNAFCHLWDTFHDLSSDLFSVDTADFEMNMHYCQHKTVDFLSTCAGNGLYTLPAWYSHNSETTGLCTFSISEKCYWACSVVLKDSEALFTFSQVSYVNIRHRMLLKTWIAGLPCGESVWTRLPEREAVEKDIAALLTSNQDPTSAC